MPIAKWGSMEGYQLKVSDGPVLGNNIGVT